MFKKYKKKINGKDVDFVTYKDKHGFYYRVKGKIRGFLFLKEQIKDIEKYAHKEI